MNFPFYIARRYLFSKKSTHAINLISAISVLGVAIAMLLTIPINAILQSIIGSVELTVTLPLTSALILVAISVIITAIGGVIPARKAASRDPVVALRTE